MERENVMKKLVDLLEKKKKNDENISAELLETKYKKSYTELKNEICRAVTTVIQNFIFSGTIIGKDEAADRFIEEAQRIVAEERAKGTFTHIRDVAFRTCDLDQILIAAMPLHNRIIYEAYADYWLANCIPCKSQKFSHYNPLIEMWYDIEMKTWIRVDEGGNVSFAVYYPPTKDLMILEENAEK